MIGIEAENSTDVSIYDNEAWDNTCGILVVSLPGLIKKEMSRASVFDNLVYSNNRENFAQEGAFVGNVPRSHGRARSVRTSRRRRALSDSRTRWVTARSTTERALYLDANCAHCHSQSAVAASTNFWLD